MQWLSGFWFVLNTCIELYIDVEMNESMNEILYSTCIKLEAV